MRNPMEYEDNRVFSYSSRFSFTMHACSLKGLHASIYEAYLLVHSCSAAVRVLYKCFTPTTSDNSYLVPGRQLHTVVYRRCLLAISVTAVQYLEVFFIGLLLYSILIYSAAATE